MKGVVLAGGTGSRLYPLTKVTNKHLLPIYNKPMVYYPLFTLKEAGITEVLIVSGRGHAGSFLELFGSGAQMGMKFAYEVQEEAGGIAQALALAKPFVGDDKFAVVLGDNVIEDDISEAARDYENEGGAKVFLKKVPDPRSYGVAEVADGKITKIVEKPEDPKSDLAVIGCYMYDSTVFDIIDGLSPSARNELEITDVNNAYLERDALTYGVLDGFWGDCGENFDSFIEVSTIIRDSRLAKVDENLILQK